MDSGGSLERLIQKFFQTKLFFILFFAPCCNDQKQSPIRSSSGERGTLYMRACGFAIIISSIIIIMLPLFFLALTVLARMSTAGLGWFKSVFRCCYCCCSSSGSVCVRIYFNEALTTATDPEPEPALGTIWPMDFLFFFLFGPPFYTCLCWLR